MKYLIKKLFFLAVMVMPFILLSAQVRIENVPDAPGKLIRKNNTLQFINSFKVLSTTKATSLANTSDKIMDIICQSPHLNPLVGYNAKVHISASGSDLKEKEPAAEVVFYLRYLVKDSRYTGIRESMDGADLYLNINDFGIFSQMGNYWKECSDLKFPLFFEEPALTDSTNNYIEFQYKGDPVRIVMAGSKPLFIPLTRKELIQFMILHQEQAVKSDNEAIKTSRASEESIKKLMVTWNESDKAEAASSLKSMDNDIKQFQKNIERSEKEIADCKSFLNSMSPQDANAPARLDYNKKSTAEGMASLERLVPVGRREGKLLVKLNPSFYNHSPNAPAAQMIVLYYAWPSVGFTQAPDYLQQAILDIFNNMDYHQLKESMQ
jgi:hypothetical protein